MRYARVSIRARHCWRAMRPPCCWQHRSGCFNPRPPLLAGDAPGRRSSNTMPGRFNPRPPLLAGDAKSHRAYPPSLVFQSAPAIAGGRCHRHKVGFEHFNCFNPRPPLLAGDATNSGAHALGWSRFQSAPAIAGGRCGVTHLDGPAIFVVSIRARHCWRAMRPFG